MWATTAVALLVAACSTTDECDPDPSSSAAGSCADLVFQGRSYDEWREVESSPIMQEVGNATYPACNAAEACDPVELDGFGATDVWLLDGADVTDAVIGLREGTHTYVIFVRVGLDPGEIIDE